MIVKESKIFPHAPAPRQSVEEIRKQTIKSRAALRDLDLTVDCKIYRHQFEIVQALAISMMDVFIDCDDTHAASDCDLTECLLAAFEAGQQSVLINPPDYGLHTRDPQGSMSIIPGMKGGAK